MAKTQSGNWNSFGQTVDSQIPPSGLHTMPRIEGFDPNYVPDSGPNSVPGTGRTRGSNGLSVFYRRLKKWFNFRKSLTSISPLNFVSMTPSKQPQFMRMVFLSIEGLNLPEPSDMATRNALIIQATFFQIQAGRFFGRTVTTKPIFLYRNNNGLLCSKEEKAFYYWTKATNPDEIIMAFEFVSALYNESTQVISKREPIGWGLVVSPFKSVRNKKNKMLYGTPRLLFSYANQPLLDPTETNYTYNCIAAPGFRCVSHLFEDLIICSTDDVLPGIENESMPLQIEEKIPLHMPRASQNQIEITSTIALLQTFKIFVNNINISISKSQLKEILDAAGEYRDNHFEGKGLSNPSISHLQLIVAFHNGWTAINSQKFENYVILNEEKVSASSPDKKFSYLGSVFLDGCFMHPFTLLVFQLDAVLDIQTNVKSKEERKIAIGWIPLFLPVTGIINNEIEVNQNFILGPGKSITNENLFTFDGASTKDSSIYGLPSPKITLNAKVNLGDLHSSPDFKKMAGGQTDDDLIASIIASKDKEKEDMRREYERRLQNVLNKKKVTIEEEFEERNQRKTNRMKGEDPLRPTHVGDNFTTNSKKEGIGESIGLGDHRLFNAIGMSRFQGKRSRFFGGQYYDRDLSRAEQMHLLQFGFEGLLVGRSGYGGDVNFFEELRDPLKASSITFQFMAVKFLHGVFGFGVESQGTLSLGSQIHALPQNIHISFEFFDFPCFKSDELKVEIDSLADLYVNPQEVHALRRLDSMSPEEPKRAVYRLEIDPSHQGGLPGRQRKFLQYLAAKCLIINIHDADSLMFFGSAKVNLRGLLRGGQPVVSIKREITIYDPETLVEKGALQLLIENQGRVPDQPELVKDDPFYVDDVPAEKDGNRIHHLRSFHPIRLDQSQLMKSSSPATDLGDIRDPNFAKKLRVQKYSDSEQSAQSIMGQRSNNVVFVGPHNHKEVIKEKEKIKWNKIMMESGFSIEKEFRIMATEGETSIIPFEIKNSFKGDQPLSIMIFDQTEEKAGEPASVSFKTDGKPHPFTGGARKKAGKESVDLSIINDPAEWKFWCKLKGYPEPQEYSIITPNNKLILTRGEQLMILFKYFTISCNEGSLTEDLDGDSSQLQLRRSSFQSKTGTDGPSASILKKTKKFKVTVADSQTGQVLWGFRLVVCLTRSSADHYYLCHRPENKYMELSIPLAALVQEQKTDAIPDVVAQTHLGGEERSLVGEWKEPTGGNFVLSEPWQKHPFVRLSNSETQVKWEEDGKLSLVMKVPTATYIYRVKLYVYRDSFCSRSIGCWSIEVFSYFSIVEEFSLGFKQRMDMNFEGGADQRIVQMFSSHPLMVSFPIELRKPYSLVPGVTNKLSLLVKSAERRDSLVRVHLVDKRLMEIVSAWLLRVKTLPPKIEKLHRFKITSGKSGNVSFSFKNPLQNSSVFEFELSLPEVLQIEIPKANFEPQESKEIRIKVNAVQSENESESHTAYLFITDSSDTVHETHQIILTIQKRQ